MKEKLRRLCRWLGEAFEQVLHRYYIELLLILYGCVGSLIVHHLDHVDALVWTPRLMLVPLFLLISLTTNLLAGDSDWRKLYWIIWLPIVPLSFWNELADWTATYTFAVTLGALAPLALLMARRECTNVRFVGDVVQWTRGMAGAMLFSYVTLGLFAAIVNSTAYIFGIYGEWVNTTTLNALIICSTLAVPLLWIMISERGLGKRVEGGKVLGILLNYIFTPALLIYAAILYLYILKITFVWSLPVGGVAYMVFGFTILVVLVKALRELLEKRICDWFYDRFSLFALPSVVLFWLGVVQRVGEYGLTVGRVWLIVCGVVMTTAVLLFFTSRTGRYLYLCGAIFIIFAVVAYVPALSPERLALQNQSVRAERIARSLGVLDDDGVMLLGALAKADTTQIDDYRQLYESMLYIERLSRDGSNELELLFGVDECGELLLALPNQMRSLVSNRAGSTVFDDSVLRRTITAPDDRCYKIAEPKLLLTNFDWMGRKCMRGYSIIDDTLHVRFGGAYPEFQIAAIDLINGQLERIGANMGASQAALDAQAEEFLTFTNEQFTILFRKISYSRDTTLTLHYADIDVVLIR